MEQRGSFFLLREGNSPVQPLLGNVVASSGRVGDARLWRVVHNHGGGSSRVDVDDNVELSRRRHLVKQKCEGR